MHSDGERKAKYGKAKEDDKTYEKRGKIRRHVEHVTGNIRV
jgi:hypothetical protein